MAQKNLPFISDKRNEICLKFRLTAICLFGLLFVSLSSTATDTDTTTIKTLKLPCIESDFSNNTNSYPDSNFNFISWFDKAVLIDTFTCIISGNATICSGSSGTLCAPIGYLSYVWNTGATTRCISVNTAGTYTVIVKDLLGNPGSCSKTVTVLPLPNCAISGISSICGGSSSQLCAPAGNRAYLWSTGATTQCITITKGGIYTDTITGTNGCMSSCTKIVAGRPDCTILGPDLICGTGPAQLCATATNALSYLWNTGATTQCISVSTAGTYTVTVTDAEGCKSTCSKTVSVKPLPTCAITGNNTFCQGSSTQVCAPAGLSSYLWTTGAPTQCITISAAGTRTVTITDVNGCKSTCSRTFSILPLPTCSITGIDTICEGSSTQLCASAAGVSSCQWNTGATTQCITVTTAGTYTVTVTGTNGCKSTCSKTVVISKPDCIIPGSGIICGGIPIQLCPNETNAFSYSWNTGPVTRCINVNAAGIFAVTVTNAKGCKSTCSKTVSIRSLPACSITGTDFCQGSTTQVCAPAGLSAYSWTTGAATQCLTVNTTGTRTVTITDANGCKSTCSKTFSGLPLPTCSITGTDTICDGNSTQLCASAAGVSTYLWNNTGATTQCITVTTAGTYTVTVTGANGCKSTCSKTVVVTKPDCTIQGNGVICGNIPVQLCPTEANAVSYLWNTGSVTRCVNAGAAGIFSVTVTDTKGCKSTCSKTAKVRALPACSISGNNDLCQGGSELICAPLSSAYLWNSNATTQCLSITTGGSRSVTITDTNGCKSTCNKTINTLPMPACGITGSSTVCEGSSIQLCATAIAGVSYLWNTTAATQCISLNSAGIYAVTTTGTNGCKSTCSKTITMNPLPNCSISGSGNLCQGDSTQLCAAAGAGLSYLWNTGPATRCIFARTGGTHTVTVTDTNGCKSTCSKPVVVKLGPDCFIIGSGAICQGSSTQFCAPAGLSSYLWNTGATTQCITVSTAGVYSVTITDASGCKSTCSKTLIVNPLPACTVSGTDVFCQGGSTQLCAPAGLSVYSWSTGAATQCISTNTAGTYSATVTDANNCKSTCSKTISVKPLPNCIINSGPLTGQPPTIQLCVPVGFVSYVWNTGATSRCISVTASGTYTVTVTDTNGCKSTCSKIVTIPATFARRSPAVKQPGFHGNSSTASNTMNRR